EVVGDLKGDTKRAAVAIEGVGDVVWSSGEMAAEVTRDRAQLGGFGFDDVEVAFFAEVKVAAFGDLPHFAFADDVGRAADEPARFGTAEAAREMKRVREQKIAEEHARLIIP